MAEFKGTPGPWVVSANSPFLVRAGDDTTGRHIAHAGPASYHPSFEVDEPNARLIAAAPDLLEALQAAIASFDEWAEDADPSSLADAQARLPWVDQARAAISLALGE